jgi:hypothetical protein
MAANDENAVHLADDSYPLLIRPCNVPRLLVVSVTSIRRVSDDECDRLVGESLQRRQAVRVDKGDVLAGVLLAIENAHGGLHLWVMDVLVNSNFGGKFF